MCNLPTQCFVRWKVCGREREVEIISQFVLMSAIQPLRLGTTSGPTH
jgi:hypothetical protein